MGNPVDARGKKRKADAAAAASTRSLRDFVVTGQRV